MDSIEQWHTIADERSAEIVRLRAALEQALNERDAAHDRIAELEHAIEVWKREELAWEEREKSIARAVAELEKMAPGDPRRDRALEALR